MQNEALTDDKVCKNCTEVYDKRPVIDTQQFYCCIDGKEVNPLGCCPLITLQKDGEPVEG